jgi:colanic acid biosynthesis protein WcaH
MWLNEKDFLEVIERTPLVSIDLVIRDPNNRILMGQRINNPAKGKWFVPGGRIYKNEDLDEAFKRITLAEVGQQISRSDATFVGLFTHKYNTNFVTTQA